jgi:hypothetical protein
MQVKFINSPILFMISAWQLSWDGQPLASEYAYSAQTLAFKLPQSEGVSQTLAFKLQALAFKWPLFEWVSQTSRCCISTLSHSPQLLGGSVEIDLPTYWARNRFQCFLHLGCWTFSSDKYLRHDFCWLEHWSLAVLQLLGSLCEGI